MCQYWSGCCVSIGVRGCVSIGVGAVSVLEWIVCVFSCDLL